jgi:hypothetical protein
MLTDELTDAGGLPPVAVRASFALLLGVVVLSLLDAVVQVAFRLTGATAGVGAVIEALLFVPLGAQMRAGRLWARMSLLSVAWVSVAVTLLGMFGLGGAFGARLTGLELLTLGYLSGKLVMIIAATVLMYRPSTRDYFR